jgi:hypothetical protein
MKSHSKIRQEDGMRQTIQEKIRMMFNLEYAKRLLIRYFIKKGFADNFDIHVYPPMIADLSKEIPQLLGKVEIVPYMEEIDPSSGTVRVGWNLFVLGHSRMYLGNSTHKDINELNLGQYAGATSMSSRKMVTPKQIIKFIVGELQHKQGGYLDTAPTIAPTPITASMASNQFYSKKRPI